MTTENGVDSFVRRSLVIAGKLKTKIHAAKKRGFTNRSVVLQILMAKRKTLQSLLAIFDQDVANLDQIKLRLSRRQDSDTADN